MKTAKTIYFISICIVFLYSLNLIAESVEYHDGITHHEFRIEEVDEDHFRFVYCRDKVCKNVHSNLEKIPYSELEPAMAQLSKEMSFVRNNFSKYFLQQIDRVTSDGIKRKWLDTTTIGEIPVRFGNSELKLSSWSMPLRAINISTLFELTNPVMNVKNSVDIEVFKQLSNSKRHREWGHEFFLWNSVHFYWYAVHAIDSQAINNPKCMEHIELLQIEINKHYNKINKTSEIQELPVVNITERSCSIIRWQKMIEIDIINSDSMKKSGSAAINLSRELIDLARQFVMDGVK